MSRTGNRLINEKSPYLLQHAYNPVDWFPWSQEAFDLAEKLNKPIFLSIGYSTCHWCHVMEHESFEDQKVADLMNDAFISIKVDREERPDIDNIYMKVTQMLTGRGGWPMTIIMTPDKKPFFAGTYFPKESVHGRIGMIDLIKQVKDVWINKPDEIESTTEKILEGLRNTQSSSSGQTLKPDIMDSAFEEYQQQYDETHGGFGNSPKFPIAHNLMFLIRHKTINGNEEALYMVENTLRKMKQGGIYDHIGLGFHRYSTDREWLLPHFEKMLYDQALISMAYTEAFLSTGKDEYKETALEIFEYILRDMTSPEGGFYSAEDADSEGVEGKFYTWEIEEINKLLPPSEAEIFDRIYNITSEGNFLDEATHTQTGLNIPHMTKSCNELASAYEYDTDQLKTKLKEIREKLFIEREKRIHPLKDDKILTDWNGLMIAALAKGGRAFNNKTLIDAAVKSADFLLANLRDDKNQLLHRYKAGDAAITANADDYAFLIWGLLELYEATFITKYLTEAISLNETFIDQFWDDSEGGFYFTSDHSEELLIRSKEIYDGAIPSGNSVAMHNFVKLSSLTADPEYNKYIEMMISAFNGDISRMPSVYSQFLSAFSLYTGQSKEVVIVGERESAETKLMLKALHNSFLPDATILFIPTDDPEDQIHKLAPYTNSYTAVEGKTTAYVCKNRVCNLPTTKIEEMVNQLK